ncbi:MULTISPECIES: citryl-CoA lyase [Nocardiaceae]|uniref:citrate synthase (unknown stereospecificity) n=1 Tax=Rhodococcoides corynebacterioides TaxID=53972 RepID=A0ABS2KZP4_9NOCA|nr:MULTISPECIES: citryl-CoA lyase [Rhodococcus]MBM7417397.1 citrate synthase [Rhodococcus corynebacterioides]MBP1115651.1 citrate synthase [Rhodococcus sp. PvP016]
MSESTETSKYWHTEISEITPETVYVRGYKLDDLIGLSFTASIYLMIKGRLPSPQETRVLDAVMTGVLDYGLEKSGTAAARYVVSCNPNMQAGMAAATLSAGDYGLATENTARFIAETHRSYVESGATDMDAFADDVVADARANKRRIPGFGHPVFRNVDPRAQILKDIAVEAGLWGEPVELYEAVHRAFIKTPGREHFPMNDVAVMAAITVALGFTPEESTALAIIGTLPGIVAHISEEMTSRKVQRSIPRDTVDYEVSRRDLRTDLAAAGWPQEHKES